MQSELAGFPPWSSVDQSRCGFGTVLYLQNCCGFGTGIVNQPSVCREIGAEIGIVGVAARPEVPVPEAGRGSRRRNSFGIRLPADVRRGIVSNLVTGSPHKFGAAAACTRQRHRES